MAPQVPSVEPSVFSAGDTVRWTKSLNDYSPDDGYVLTYAFRGEKGDGKLDLTATNDNGTHAITITPTQSNLMRPGIWVWAAYATLGTDRYKVGQGTTKVEPNLAVTNFATDLRTPVKVRYDMALEMERKVNLGQTVILNGRTYTQHNLDALQRWIDRAKSDYAAELQEKDNTGGDPRKVYVSFNRYD
jgi:hypothetical protein